MENWYAFALCICAEKFISIDVSFNQIYGVKGEYKNLTPDDVAEMVELKDVFSYREIGDMYGMSKGAVADRIRRFRRTANGS